MAKGFKSLRARLFLSFGLVLLGISLFSLFMSYYLVERDIKNASMKILEAEQKNIGKIRPAVITALDNMHNTILGKISLNLASAALIGLAIGCYLLAKISKAVTKPISILARAAVKIENGEYEEISFPKMDQRKDEIATLSTAFEKMAISLKEREKIRGILNKVVPKEIAKEILKGGVELGGEERVATILFSDIRNFTAMSENVPPHILIGLMNTYLTEVCKTIDENKGIVDKFVGDEVMALYGVPIAYQDHAAQAIRTACGMMDSLKKVNEKRAALNRPPIHLGIGIHTGLVVAGNVGSENRLNYTVLGANVNIASRLCSAAKPMQILISDATRDAIQPKELFQYKELPPVSLKGISHPVKVFEIIAD